MIEYIFELAFSAGVTRTTAFLPASPHGRRMYSPAASFASTSASFFAPLTARMSSYISRRSRSEEHTSELQSRFDLVCRLLLEKKHKTPKFQLHDRPDGPEKRPHRSNRGS